MHVLIRCKVCHWHPPAGSVSQTRIVVYEDGSFYFQVLRHSKEAGTMETIDHFLSVCEMMANHKTAMTSIIKRAKMFASSNHMPVTLLSGERVCTALYGVGYSLSYYLLLLRAGKLLSFFSFSVMILGRRTFYQA